MKPIADTLEEAAVQCESVLLKTRMAPADRLHERLEPLIAQLRDVRSYLLSPRYEFDNLVAGKMRGGVLTHFEAMEVVVKERPDMQGERDATRQEIAERLS